MDEVLITRRGKTGGVSSMGIEVLKLNSHGDENAIEIPKSKIGSDDFVLCGGSWYTDESIKLEVADDVYKVENDYQFDRSSLVECIDDEFMILGCRSNGTTSFTIHSSGTSVSADLLFNATGGSAEMFDGELHVISGNNHYSYDGSTWTSVGTLAFDFSYGALVAYKDKDSSHEALYALFNQNGVPTIYKFNGTDWRESAISVNTDNTFVSRQACKHNGWIHYLMVNPSGEYLLYAADNTETQYIMTLPPGLTLGSLPMVSDGEDLFVYDEGNNRLYCVTTPARSVNLDFTLKNICAAKDGIYLFAYGDGIVRKFSPYSDTWREVSVLPYSFYHGSAVVYNNEIHILGGSIDATSHYAYDSNRWIGVSNLPYSFYRGSAVVYNDEIHILGGEEDNGTSHYKFTFNGTSYSWVSVSTLPYNFFEGAAVVYNDEIHILGGYQNQTAHYKYDGANWVLVSTLEHNFYRGSAVVYNDEIHILGGGGHPSMHDAWDGNAWTICADLPFNWGHGFYYGSAVVYNNEIHIIGSLHSDVNKMHCYINHDDYSRRIDLPDIPATLSGGCAVTYNDKIHILYSDRTHYTYMNNNRKDRSSYVVRHTSSLDDSIRKFHIDSSIQDLLVNYEMWKGNLDSVVEVDSDYKRDIYSHSNFLMRIFGCNNVSDSTTLPAKHCILIRMEKADCCDYSYIPTIDDEKISGGIKEYRLLFSHSSRVETNTKESDIVESCSVYEVTGEVGSSVEWIEHTFTGGSVSTKTFWLY